MSETADSVSDSKALQELQVEMPAVGTPVYLLLNAQSLRTQLESLDGNSFTVAAPADVGGLGAVEVGQELDIFWAVPRNRLVLPCRLTEVSDQAPHQWTLAPTATVRHDDRRRFARGGAGATVELQPEAKSGPIAGKLIDISEGGLRCWTDGTSSLAPGDRVGVTVWLGTREEHLDTVIHTVRQLPQGDPGQHLILTFEAKDEVAKLIQQYVIAWEIGERRRKH